MFTGIIKELGKVTKVEKAEKSTTFVIQAKEVIKNKKIGDSIAINGVCTTITKLNETSFQVELMPETIKITNLSRVKENSEVNLEDSLTLQQGIDGHLVQGHVDTTGEVTEFTKNEDQVRLTVSFPKKIEKLLALKGSITLNGVSLTISDLRTSTLTVDLIPLTLKETNLKDLKPGDQVNIEIDLIARYLKNMLDSKEKESKYEYLKERNFL